MEAVPKLCFGTAFLITSTIHYKGNSGFSLAFNLPPGKEIRADRTSS
jgi:hypothetical protein